MGAIQMIAQRRRHQIEDGHTPEFDKEHDQGELADAAWCYLGVTYDEDDSLPAEWPFDPAAWKPSVDPIDNLVEAAALLAAEVDRLLIERGTS